MRLSAPTAQILVCGKNPVASTVRHLLAPDDKEQLSANQAIHSTPEDLGMQESDAMRFRSMVHHRIVGACITHIRNFHGQGLVSFGRGVMANLKDLGTFVS
jgi:hypothetical protein